MKSRCKAIKQSGDLCTLRAGSSGYCHIHDPQRIAERTRTKEKNLEKLKLLDEVLAVIHSTCHSKGWHSDTSSLDLINGRYATISVDKSVRSGYDYQTITGTFDITVAPNKGVRVAMNKTSFYGYGLQDLLDSIEAELGRLQWLKSPEDKEEDIHQNATVSLEHILKRFHIAARSLKNRHNDRTPMIIEDEYDAQDLLLVLLRVVFDDVRPEEYSPSYAATTSRVDFLLKSEQVFVEVKMANKNLRDKQVADQLIIDISRYQTHPDCKHLVCLVYDPNDWIRNPIALENDLTGKHGKIDVKIFVVPH